MVPQILILLIAAAAQTDVLFAGPVPAEVPTFEVTLGTRAPFHAGLRIDGHWVHDHGTEIPPTTVVDFVPDTPFYSGAPSRTLMRNAHLVYEPPAMRRKRLEDLWDSLGYTFLETTSGWRRVRKEDLELAQRAQELAQAADTVQQTAKGKSPVSKTASTAAQKTRFGPGLIWLYRAGILLSAVLLLVLIFVFGSRHNTRWQRLE